MKNEAIDKAVDKLLEAEDYDTRMVRKFGGDGDNIEGLRSHSLRNNFDEVADDFLEQYGVEEVEEEEFVKLATTLDSMGEEAVEARGRYFAVQAGNKILFVDTSGYDYPRYKALLYLEDLKSDDEKELDDFEALDAEFGEGDNE